MQRVRPREGSCPENQPPRQDPHHSEYYFALHLLSPFQYCLASPLARQTANWLNRTDKIQSWIEKNPDQIHKVPVIGCGFHRPVFLRTVTPLDAIAQDDEEENHTCKHVEVMHAGHHVENRAFNPVGWTEGSQGPLKPDHAN